MALSLTVRGACLATALVKNLIFWSKKGDVSGANRANLALMAAK